MESIIQIHFPNKEPRPKRSNLSQTEFCDRSITVETLGILHGKKSTKQRIGLTGERRSAWLTDVSLLSSGTEATIADTLCPAGYKNLLILSKNPYQVEPVELERIEVVWTFSERLPDKYVQIERDGDPRWKVFGEPWAQSYAWESLWREMNK